VAVIGIECQAVPVLVQRIVFFNNCRLLHGLLLKGISEI
jgi:hypothetical protein